MLRPKRYEIAIQDLASDCYIRSCSYFDQISPTGTTFNIQYSMIRTLAATHMLIYCCTLEASPKNQGMLNLIHRHAPSIKLYKRVLSA